MRANRLARVLTCRCRCIGMHIQGESDYLATFEIDRHGDEERVLDCIQIPSPDARYFDVGAEYVLQVAPAETQEVLL